MIDLNQFQVIKDIAFNKHLFELLNQYLLNDSKIMESLIRFLSTKEKQVSQEEIKFRLSELKLDFRTLQNSDKNQFISVNQFLSGDDELILALTSINLGVGSKGIQPNPWFIRLQNQLKKEN